MAPKPEDLKKYINMKIGNMTIINAYRDNGFVFFDVECDCGNKICHLQKSNFLNQRSIYRCVECEIKSRLDRLLGQKFNKLTIFKSYYEKREKHRGSTLFVDCICECGEIRNHIPLYKLKEGIIYSCRKCAKSISSMELFISDILDSNKVNYIFQYKFSDCKEIFELPFDFYLYDLNILIEYDGSQHFEQNHFSNSLEEFRAIQRHDNIKTKYAKDNGIKLIRFNYKDSKEYIENNLLSIIGCENKKEVLGLSYG